MSNSIANIGMPVPKFKLEFEQTFVCECYIYADNVDDALRDGKLAYKHWEPTGEHRTIVCVEEDEQ